MHYSPLSPFRLIILIFLFPQLIISDGPSECFYLDGSAATDHQPCIPAANRSETTHSTCCVLGQPVGNSNDICTEQGLCFAQQSSNSMAFLFQGGCTDSSLMDEACRSPCAPLTNGTKFFAIEACSNGRFCCSAPNEDSAGNPGCCSGSTFQLNLSLALQATSSTAQSTAQSTTQSTSSVASCTAIGGASSFSTTTSCPKNATVVVSASVGAVLGSLLLAALASIVLLRRRLGQERQQHQQQWDRQVAAGKPVVQDTQVPEKDSNGYGVHEMPEDRNGYRVHEMPVASPKL